MKNILIACGTRPDVLKLSPVWEALGKNPDFNVKIWWSGQGKDIFPAEHQFMVDETPYGAWTGLNAGISFTIGQFDLYLASLSTLDFDLVVVHGDDATAFACCLAAFNREIPVAHVEAGLRTYQSTPFPEEAYRRSIATMASLHFAPDHNSRLNLENEQVPSESIFVVGNTANDVVRSAMPQFDGVMNVIATLHRRENTGPAIQRALANLGYWAETNEVTMIKHPNWQDRYTLPSFIDFINPIPHDELLEMIAVADLVVTDSGGIQEECAFLCTPCIVYRESTERTALLLEGSVVLAPPSDEFSLLRELNRAYRKRFAYGNGQTGPRIASIISQHLGTTAPISGIEAKASGWCEFPG